MRLIMKYGKSIWILLFSLIITLSSCSFATKGDFIGKYKNPKKALLVMDIQNDFTSPNAKMPVDSIQATDMIKNINSILEQSEHHNYLVVYIRNEFGKGNFIANIFRNYAAIKGSPGAEFDKRLKVINNNYFSKDEPDAFSSEKLNEFLTANQVDELYICGVFADQCVYWTSRGALNRKYKVNIIEDCVATDDDKAKLKAIEKYKENGINVISSTELINKGS